MSLVAGDGDGDGDAGSAGADPDFLVYSPPSSSVLISTIRRLLFFFGASAAAFASPLAGAAVVGAAGAAVMEPEGRMISTGSLLLRSSGEKKSAMPLKKPFFFSTGTQAGAVSVGSGAGASTAASVLGDHLLGTLGGGEPGAAAKVEVHHEHLVGGDAVAQVHHAGTRILVVARARILLDQQRELVVGLALVADVLLAGLDGQHVGQALIALHLDHALQVLHVVGTRMTRMLAQEAVGGGECFVGLEVAVQDVDFFQLGLRGVLGERIALGQRVVAQRGFAEVGRFQRTAGHPVQSVGLELELLLGHRRAGTTGRVAVVLGERILRAIARLLRIVAAAPGEGGCRNQQGHAQS